jgi:hypothetical protein
MSKEIISRQEHVDAQGVGYVTIKFQEPKPQFKQEFKLCSCPNTWGGNKHHHPLCIRAAECFFCQMSKVMCKRLGICKGGPFKANSKRVAIEQTINDDIFQNLKATLQRMFQQIAALSPQIPESDKKKSSCKKAMACRKQYEEMKLLQNPSAANVDSAEICLYKLKCVYTDLKSMLKPKQSSA